IISSILSFNIYANSPEFIGGTVVSVKDFSETFKDNIVLVNYSNLDNIDIEFSIYKDSNWQNIGNITSCKFGDKVTLPTKEKLKGILFFGYKANLPKDKKIFIDVRNHDLNFYILESTNNVFGTSTQLSNIKQNPSNGIYKFDTTEQRRDYEDNIKIEGSPTCIIMFPSPNYGTWDVFGFVINGKLKTFYDEDLDDYSPYWVIQVLDENKFYDISAYSKRSDLYFRFSKTDSIKEDSEIFDTIESQLIKLKQYYDNGLINEDEYKEKKANILGL
ncbi:MAG: SHOCT domain-containing protein, partial [Treponema sp.]|nr:SHOCT domain-containing protein [Treponema sp.]